MNRCYYLDYFCRFNAIVWGITACLAFIAGYSIDGLNAGCLSLAGTLLVSIVSNHYYERRFSGRFYGWWNEVLRLVYYFRQPSFPAQTISFAEAAMLNFVATAMVDPSDKTLNRWPNRESLMEIVDRWPGLYEIIGREERRLVAGAKLVLAIKIGMEMLWLERIADRLVLGCRVPMIGDLDEFEEYEFVLADVRNNSIELKGRRS